MAAATPTDCTVCMKVNAPCLHEGCKDHPHLVTKVLNQTAPHYVKQP